MCAWAGHEFTGYFERPFEACAAGLVRLSWDAVSIGGWRIAKGFTYMREWRKREASAMGRYL